jgi:hypothetical protein
VASANWSDDTSTKSTHQEVLKMQATLQLRRFPVALIGAAFGLAVALVLGLALGYALKASVVTTSPGHVVVISAQAPTAGEDKCIFVNHQKEC